MEKKSNFHPIMICDDMVCLSDLLNKFKEDDDTGQYLKLCEHIETIAHLYGTEIGYGVKFCKYDHVEALLHTPKTDMTSPKTQTMKKSKISSTKKKLLDSFFAVNVSKVDTRDLLIDIKNGLIETTNVNYLKNQFTLDFKAKEKEINETDDAVVLSQCFHKIQTIAKQSSNCLIQTTTLLGKITKKFRALQWTWGDITDQLKWSETKLRNCIIINDLIESFPRFLGATCNISVLITQEKKIKKYLSTTSYEELAFWQMIADDKYDTFEIKGEYFTQIETAGSDHHHHTDDNFKLYVHERTQLIVQIDTSTTTVINVCGRCIDGRVRNVDDFTKEDQDVFDKSPWKHFDITSSVKDVTTQIKDVEIKD